VSTFRDSITPASRPGYDEAVAAAGRIFAAVRRERDELAACGGAEAVAEAVGGPSREEIAALYTRLREQAQQKGRTAA